jgi:hypothetical protein
MEVSSKEVYVAQTPVPRTKERKFSCVMVGPQNSPEKSDDVRRNI